MNLKDLVDRQRPEPWCQEKIPWNDPDFSRRMLESHLSQDHDWASRRHEIIDRHVRWIANRFSDKKARILDLGCGPGFYTQDLAQRGFHCTGVDFSPASIDYARKQAGQSGLDIEYILDDIRNITLNEQFDCVLLTFGEFNVFSDNDAIMILRNASNALVNDGLLLLEGHMFDAVEYLALAPAMWFSYPKSVFSDTPHLCLQENFWDEKTTTATTRYFVIDAETSSVHQYGSSMKAWHDAQYHQMLLDAGFANVEILNSVDWPPGDDFDGKLQTFIGSKSEKVISCVSR